MGQFITVTVREGSSASVRIFDLNRSLTGMAIERYPSAAAVKDGDHRPPARTSDPCGGSGGAVRCHRPRPRSARGTHAAVGADRDDLPRRPGTVGGDRPGGVLDGLSVLSLCHVYSIAPCKRVSTSRAPIRSEVVDELVGAALFALALIVVLVLLYR